MTSMNDVNIEAGKVEVEVFTRTEAALASLREQYSKVPDFDTTEGYEQGKQALKTITGYRTNLEKERKRIKAPYLEAGKIIDDEAKRITGELVALEEPLKTAKQAVDEREKRQKEERIAKLQGRIDAMRGKVREARGQDSATVAALIEEVDAIDTQGEFYELTSDAVQAQRDVLDELGAIYSDRVHAEQAEAERAEAERERARQEQAQAIERRINAIRTAPLDLMGKPAHVLRSALEAMRVQYPSDHMFGDRHAEAMDLHEQALGQIETMTRQAEQLEAAEEQQKAESRRQDEQLARDVAETRPQPMPEWSGVDMAGEPDQTVEASIPAEDKACATQLRDEHQEKLDAFNAAAYDIQGILESVTGHGSREHAEMVLNDIISGEVRHVTFNGTTAA